MAWRDNASVGNVTVEKRLKIEGSVEGWGSGCLGNHYYVDGNIGTNGVGDHITWYMTYKPLAAGVTVTAQ